MKLKQEPGFSLVELIVVIVITGILASAAIARYKSLSDATEAATCKQNQFNLETAQSFFYMDRYMDPDQTTRYAESFEELAPYFPEGRLPQCPSANGEYLLLPNGVVDCTDAGHHR
ncbi:MAG TPA: type II secretion system protein [bacterium]|nr:type II secretion system protein [bacterium]